jgi:hypothetical protein
MHLDECTFGPFFWRSYNKKIWGLKKERDKQQSIILKSISFLWKVYFTLMKANWLNKVIQFFRKKRKPENLYIVNDKFVFWSFYFETFKQVFKDANCCFRIKIFKISLQIVVLCYRTLVNVITSEPSDVKVY